MYHNKEVSYGKRLRASNNITMLILLLKKRWIDRSPSLRRCKLDGFVTLKSFLFTLVSGMAETYYFRWRKHNG